MSDRLEGMDGPTEVDRAGGSGGQTGLTPQGIAEATTSALRQPLDDLRQRVTALETAVRASLGDPSSLAPMQGSAVDRKPDPLRRLWSAAPLTQRLAFLRGLLPPQHPRQTVLGEVSRLVELTGTAGELQAWIQRYPSLFAEAAARIMVPQEDPEAGDDLDRVATELLLEARDLVSARIADLHVSWILPGTGTLPNSDCEVIGEEPATDLPPGSIKLVRRPGFRHLGRLELPAQVILAGTQVSSPPAVPFVEVPQKPLPATGLRAGIAPGNPEWLQVLGNLQGEAAPPEAQRCFRSLSRVAQAGGSATDGEIIEAIGPLLVWLGTGWDHTGTLPPRWLEALTPYRSKLCEWLASELNTELVSAVERDPFEPDLMEGVGERRTAHPHERGTVARLQSPGLRRRGRVLLRARVIRYEGGGVA